MISQETAKKLKDAGLEWEPELGDFYYNTPFTSEPSFLDNNTIANSIKESKQSFPSKGDVFAPRLDQLLHEIHKRKCMCYWDSGQPCSVGLVWNVHEKTKVFTSKILEDAVANALLWLLEKRR